MSEEFDSDSLEQFCNVTGGSEESARTFLEVSNGDVENAITLFLESGGIGFGSSTPPERQPTFSSQIASRGHLGNESPNDYDFMDEDEELARKLMEEESHGAVRAPIAPKNDVLLGENYDRRGLARGIGYPRESLYASNPRASLNIFNQGDSSIGNGASNHEAFRDFAEETADLQRGSSSLFKNEKAVKLAELFRPPFDIMFRGDFETARNEARSKSKWLMVSIQKHAEFSCLAMNRDLWSDKTVKDVVKESFIFLQYGSETQEGKKYVTFYHIDNYPHVAIIDPRTGERVKMWSTQMETGEFLVNVADFLGRASFSGSSSTSNTPAMKNKKIEQASSQFLKQARNISEMTEEEQLDAAIAASLAGNASESQSVVDLTRDDDVMVIEDGEQGVATLESQQETVGIESITAVNRDEPPLGTGVTRVQFRLPDGKRVVRRFMKDDLVRYLFEYVRAEVEGAQEQDFELVFNRQQLIEQIDQTIEEAKVENALVTLAWS